MKRDIRINYSVLDEIAASIHTYKNNIESMKVTLDKIHTKIEENSGKSIDALKESYKDVSRDMTKAIEELNELHTLFSEYTSSMEQHIKAINREKLVQVDRDDIWINIKSIENGYYRITELNNKTHLFNGSFFADGEQKEKEETNGDKIEEIKALARQCVSKLDYKIEEINYLFNTKVVPFEDTDDEFASRVEPIYNKYTSVNEKIINTIDQYGDNLKDLQLGFVEAVKDLIVFAFELVEGIIINTAAVVTLMVADRFGCEPKWAKDTLNNTKDSITAIIKDPMLILEGISQGVSDAVDTKGIAYCTGYAVGGLVGQKGIDKVLKAVKSMGAVGEVAEGAKQAKIRERILKNIEESKIAREASNYQEFAKIDTKIYAENNNWVDKAGNIIWPPNRGLDGEAVIETLKPGTKIDRYGFEGGTFVSPEGISYPSRALAPGTYKKPYNIYEVIKPIDAQVGKIAPWFGEPGGGIQYELSASVKKLIEDGFIRRVEIK